MCELLNMQMVLNDHLKYNMLKAFIILVGYDVTFNEYGWYRPPTLHNNIHLDNHDVGIEPFKDTYVSEGSQTSS